MSEVDKSKPTEFKAEQALWNLYREGRRAKGLDIAKLLLDFAATEAQRLALPGARQDFTELCEAGCTPEVLAAIIALLRVVPEIEGFWTTIWTVIAGDPKNRSKITRTLENAALTIEQLFGDVTAADDQEKLRTTLSQMGHLHPAEVASELRFYTGFLNVTETWVSDTDLGSIRQLLKYILVGYVSRATGRFHDRNVARLLAEVERSADFNEVAQRMWRSRNYARLHGHFSQISDFLFAIGVVIARSRT